MYLLVDCNNFFVSCERIFNPKLRNKPVVILSNNDGCIIARSQEAKNLGIPMGAPFFQWEEFLERNKVRVLSSNFALYGDFSFRVMQTLASFCPNIEIYSIDEAFLYLGSEGDPEKFGRYLKQKVEAWTGIPISIGIAKSKTLAKVANKKAKKDPKLQGVFALLCPDEEKKILDLLPVEEVWGIGRRIAAFLERKGIWTAGQLICKDDSWIRENLTVTGLRTVWELRGIPCLSMEESAPPKKSIMTSRSFAKVIVAEKDLEEAVASFASLGAEKLREEKRLAGGIQVFVMTSPNRRDEHPYANAAYMTFPEPTAFTPTILSYANIGLKQIFREGFYYKRVGVLLTSLVSPSFVQQDCFAKSKESYTPKQMQLMQVIDNLNQKFGYSAVYFASEGITQSWKTKRRLTSPSFTTSWDDLLTIYI